jgi:hypothetical protein
VILKNDDIDLDFIGVLEGSDKSSSVEYCWDYLRHYQELFSQWKNESINIIEIGIGRGISLTLWLNYFTRARIIGVDINQNCKKYERERVVVEIGSQNDEAFLQRLCKTYPPTIIIDDGSHRADHIIYTFERMFPSLLSGGLYIIEDLAFHYWPDCYCLVEGVKAPEYFLKMAESCMANSLRSEDIGKKRYIYDHTDYIRFIKSAAVIRKKEETVCRLRIKDLENEIRQNALSPEQIMHCVEYIVCHGGPLESAEEILSNIPLSHKNPQYFKTLASIQRKQNKYDKSIDTLKEGVGLCENDYDLLWRLGHYQYDYENYKEAADTLQKACALCLKNEGSAEGIYNMLSDVYVRQGMIDDAINALRACVKIVKSEFRSKTYEIRLTELLKGQQVQSPTG